MLGLTPLGAFHTAISLIAVAAGLIAFVRYAEITLDNPLGRIYLLTTVITAATGFGIFQHGGWGAPHTLGVITLVVLAVAILAGKTDLFGRASPYIETVGYSATFLFHMIPAVTETATRLPLGSPLLASRDDPALQAAVAVLLVAFLIGATLQVLRLRARFRRYAS